MTGRAPAPYVGIVAALGPTNTGKTHRAIERMLEHRSGIIGLPLRLLAREVYDRITARIGERRVALVTGEEKRVPPQPDYWVCTVESMPSDREVDFVAVDEIQLAGNRQRGHVFTDRLLNARGRLETWFMGAETIRPIVQELVPTAEHRRHTRLSQLRSAGSLSLGALPPRTAVVAFSSDEVYELAERLRRRRGGAAVVLGALSPRTRNAQVALYQAGEVDYLVATDAIGMGLNMDVDMVAFASLRKFDGQELRELEADELAQIAGRAGRAENDGRFCTLAPLPPLPDPVVHAIETHRFPELRRVFWRNSDLDFRSVEALIESLKQRPPRRVLEPVRKVEDFDALVRLAARPEIQALAKGRAAVQLLWDVCQIPDFRKLLFDGHIELLGEVYRQLAGPRGRLDADWMRERIDRIANTEGDIHTLMTRIAFVRTWTYISNHRMWVADAEYWQERTRLIEDILSDALHERLMARFVEREGQRHFPGPGSGSAATPARPGKRKSASRPADAQEIDLDSPFAKLLELSSRLPVAAPISAGAANDEGWVHELVEAPHERFCLDDEGWILDGERKLARLRRGVDLLRPEVALTPEVEALAAGSRARILRRLVAWTRDLVGQLLAPLRQPALDKLSSDARGLVYQLEQGLGTIHRHAALGQVQRSSAKDRELLRAAGVEFGELMIWLPKLLQPAALRERALLIWTALGRPTGFVIPRAGAVALLPDPEIDQGAYTALGYPVFGPRALRVDIVERVVAELQELGKAGELELPSELASRLGVRRDELPAVLVALGAREVEGGSWRMPVRDRSSGERTRARAQRRR